MPQRKVRIRQIQLSCFTECSQHEAEIGVLEIEQHALRRCANGRCVLRREARRTNQTAQEYEQDTIRALHHVPAFAMRMTTLPPFGVANSAAPFVTRLNVQSPTR